MVDFPNLDDLQVCNIILSDAFVTGEYEEFASTIGEVCSSLFIQYTEYVVYHICLGDKNR